jgi:hypothetical protein
MAALLIAEFATVQGIEDAMKLERILGAMALLLGLLVVVFLVANFWVGSGSSTTAVDIARSKCVIDGFPAQDMIADFVEIDNGMFGFGGRATVEFSRDGRKGEFDPAGKRIPNRLRVELRRRMNLSEWEAASVVQDPPARPGQPVPSPIPP